MLLAQAAERQARINSLTPEVRLEIDSLSHLVTRLEQQLSELEDMEIEMIVSSRVKRCALERDCEIAENASEFESLCDFMDSSHERTHAEEQMRRVEAERLEDADLSFLMSDIEGAGDRVKRSKTGEDDMCTD